MTQLYSQMHERLKTLLASRLNLWILLWAGIAFIYFPAWKGGFEQDFHGWLQMYTDYPFWDAINRKFAGINSFYQLTQLQLYGWTILFGTHPLPWFLLFTALHALNGLLLFRLTRNLLDFFDLPHSNWIALISCLFFLFNPGQTEVVLWKACYHYLIGIQIILWVLIWTLRYIQTGHAKWAWMANLLMLLATLTLETWYTIPWLILVLAVTCRRGLLITAKQFRDVFRHLIGPMFLIFGSYLLIYHARFGQWVAHSAYRQPDDHNLRMLSGRIWSYEFHLLALGRFFPEHYRQWFYTHISENGIATLFLVLILIGLAIFFLVRLPRSGPVLRVCCLFSGWALIALIVVIHFLPESLMYIRNDRYLYYSALFQSVILTVLIFQILRQRARLRMILISLLLCIYLGLTSFLVWQWRSSNKVFWGIQDNFHWNNSPQVLLLNLPGVYNGAGLILASIPDDFSEHLRIFYHLPNRHNIYDVAGYNMTHLWDGAHVQVLDSLHLKVTLNQWGTWWWYGGLGAVDYSNEIYQVHFTDPGHEYLLSLKQRPPGQVILYNVGTSWKQVDFSNHGEQW